MRVLQERASVASAPPSPHFLVTSASNAFVPRGSECPELLQRANIIKVEALNSSYDLFAHVRLSKTPRPIWYAMFRTRAIMGILQAKSLITSTLSFEKVGEAMRHDTLCLSRKEEVQV